jgi:hypothetical protein
MEQWRDASSMRLRLAVIAIGHLNFVSAPPRLAGDDLGEVIG